MITAQTELLNLARGKAEELKISFSEALLKVARERPELAAEVREEVLKSQTVFESPPEKQELAPGPAQAEFLRRVKAKTQEDGVTFSEALRSVARDRPILASDYRKEVTKSKF